MRASSSTTRMRVGVLMGPSYPLSDRMPARPRRSALPNLKVYRVAWVVALILVVISLFTLGRPDTPKLSLEPVSFDGEQAAADLRTIVTDYPQRVAGTDPDNRLALWVVQQFKQAGLETVSFDGEQAAADLRTIVTDYPQRVAGTDPDNRLALWVVQQFKQAGLE